MKAPALGVGAALLAYLCVALTREPGGVSALWLADGLTTAVLLRARRREWPTLGAAAFIGNVAGDLATGAGLRASLGFTACGALGFLTCAAVVRRYCGRNVDLGRL